MSFVIDHLSKAYPGAGLLKNTPVLRNVSYTLDAGRALALIGQNGAGKTTLLKCILGFLRPDSGTAQLDGQTIPALMKENKVGYMPEQLGKLSMTPREYVSTLMLLRGLPKAAFTDRLEELAGLLYLTKYLDKPMTKCSKGTVKKTIFLQSILHCPAFLILDEPTDGLDPIARRAMLAEIRSLKTQGCTLIITTHLLSDLMLVADEAAILQKGALLTSVDTAALPSSLDEWYYRQIMESGGMEDL
jgi:ABC-2 type transport system ATP-binding protein